MVANKRASQDAGAECLPCHPVSRRSLLAGSIGTAALVAVPDLFSARSGTAALSNKPENHFFLYGALEPSGPGPMLEAARPAGFRSGNASVALDTLAARLAALPL